jgi:hemolysin activation/secretion protein
MKFFPSLCTVLLTLFSLNVFGAGLPGEPLSPPSPPPPAAVAAQVDEIPRFDIKSYLLEGNTLLPTDRVHTVFAEHSGVGRDFGDIQQVMEKLEKAYRDLGYTMVTIILPEQELTGGVVRLQAIESRVTAITVDGNTHFSRENILTSLPTLQVGARPHVNAISENLRAANENPARKMTLQFKAQDNPEELHAALQVTDQKPWKLNLSGDNSGSDATGLYRLGLGFQYFNLFDRDHVAALQYTTSPDHFSAVKIVSGSYRLPFYRLGDTLDLFGAYSDVDSGTSQISGTDIKISGKGIVSGFRYNINLPRFGEYEQKLVGGMDYRFYDNSAVVLATELAADVVAHPLSLTYGGAWTTEPLTVDGSLGLLYNIPWGSKGIQSDYRAARSGAAADYFLLRYGLNGTYRPGADWLVRITTSGQYTSDRLIPGEQFGYGGSAFLRGYKEREESWDAGFSGSFEIYSPDIALLLKIPNTQFRLLGFFDGGTGYAVRPQPWDLDKSIGDSNALKSIGAGFRLGMGDIFSFTLDWGFALDDSSETKRGDNAVHFKGQVSY